MRIPRRLPSYAVLAAAFLTSAGAVEAADRQVLRDWLGAAIEAACPAGLKNPEGIASVLGATVLAFEENDEEARLSRRWLALEDPDKGELVMTANGSSGQLQSLVVEASEMAGEGGRRPALMARTDRTCTVVLAREIVYGADGSAAELLHLDAGLSRGGEAEPLNPAVPAAGSFETEAAEESEDGAGDEAVAPRPEILVALVDSGVNYLLPEIGSRLARDRTGAILGYDYWDLDERPYDVNPARSPFLPLHHGTTVASVLLREAPGALLVPYRYPRPDMSRMAELVAAAEAAGARIVAMAMGSGKATDWEAFEQAAAERPELLFIVSAGNDNRDIDADPLYPASLDLSNMLVVTSADDFGRLATGSNWGTVSVDLMVPAERIEVIDHRGARARTSGSSYAVPRVAAMAARLWAANPEWNANTLRHAINAYAAVPRIRGQSPVREGWIPNPEEIGR